jgi:hypothetical protein
MHALTMSVRDVEQEERTVTGIVAPYDEVTYLVADPDGERIRRGAFNRSIGYHHDPERRGGPGVPLFRDHNHSVKVGRSVGFEEEPGGLVGTFKVLDGPEGDKLMDHLRYGNVDSFSVGFQPIDAPIGKDGVREIREARLVEVSAVALPAYGGARVLAVRLGGDLERLLAPLPPPPVVNLDPLPSFLYRSA